jgi:hypothetical protein
MKRITNRRIYVGTQIAELRLYYYNIKLFTNTDQSQRIEIFLYRLWDR